MEKINDFMQGVARMFTSQASQVGGSAKTAAAPGTGEVPPAASMAERLQNKPKRFMAEVKTFFCTLAQMASKSSVKNEAMRAILSMMPPAKRGAEPIIPVPPRPAKATPTGDVPFARPPPPAAAAPQAPPRSGKAAPTDVPATSPQQIKAQKEARLADVNRQMAFLKDKLKSLSEGDSIEGGKGDIQRQIQAEKDAIDWQAGQLKIQVEEFKLPIAQAQQFVDKGFSKEELEKAKLQASVDIKGAVKDYRDFADRKLNIIKTKEGHLAKCEANIQALSAKLKELETEAQTLQAALKPTVQKFTVTKPQERAVQAEDLIATKPKEGLKQAAIPIPSRPPPEDLIDELLDDILSPAARPLEADSQAVAEKELKEEKPVAAELKPSAQPSPDPLKEQKPSPATPQKSIQQASNDIDKALEELESFFKSMGSGGLKT